MNLVERKKVWLIPNLKLHIFFLDGENTYFYFNNEKCL